MCRQRKMFLLCVLLTSSAALVHGRSLDKTPSCREGFEERKIQDGLSVITRCCHPISICGPGHEVVDCKEDYGEDQCLPCAGGLVQPSPSSSHFRQRCAPPHITCAEEAEPRLEGGAWRCQCDTGRNYCGLPSDCRKEDRPCGKGFYLHHESCRCVAGGNQTPAPEPPTVTSESRTTSTSYSTLPPTDGQDVKETGNKTQIPVAEVTSPKTFDDGLTSGTTTPTSSAKAERLALMGVGIFLGVLLLVLVIIGLVFMFKLRSSSNFAQRYPVLYCKITSIANIIIPNGFPGNDHNRNTDRPPAENEETERKTSSPICQEGGGQQEEEGPGDDPHKRLLLPPSDCVPLNQHQEA